MSELAFLQDGGEMGERMRAHDWSMSSLGDPADWPQSLRSVVGLMINSRYPMFCAWGPELAFLYNDGYISIFGAKHPHTLGLPFRDVWSEIWDDISPLVDSALSGVATYDENLHLVMERNGFPEDTWYDFSYSPVRDESGAVAGMFCACTETTAQVLADRAMRESESRFRNLADQSPSMVWVTDADGSCTYLSRSWYEFTGQQEGAAIGSGWLDAVHPDDRVESDEAFRSANSAQRQFKVEYRLRGADGSYRWAIDAASPLFAPDGTYLGYVGSVVDIDERKQVEELLRKQQTTLESRVGEEVERRIEAEDALRQAQKMETIGQLTGGIAHDFNNLLQIIAGNLDILQRGLPEDSPRLRRSVDNAMTGADRAATLTQRLLAFSRRQPLAPKVIDPNKLVSNMSEMLHRTLGEPYALETVLGAGLWRVEVDPNQLETALINLAVNSRDAMPTGGKLTIETANTHLDRRYAEAHSGIMAGQYVAICVTDSGSGMDEATADRAFEPFFTTKEVGRGTGLGLSMVYGFVKQSGGHLKIYSEVGQGTTVKIYLPRHHGAESVVLDETRVGLPDSAQSETILVCEDDADVREFSAESLRELGYRVIEAGTGEAALDLLDPAGEPIDLLFTDVVLPGITGAVLADRARALRPDLRILFTTGYARNAIVHQGRLDAGVELLSKPFTFADLATRIRDLLDAPSPA